jgi:hypothetical protein
MGPLILAVVLAGGAATWTPPAQPDPSRILDEARSDAKAGRHEVALAKHEWYHREALQILPAQGAVRQSIALGFWRELGQAYPPALSSLKRFRDEALQKVLKGTGDFPEFHEFVSINRVLEETSLTREAFLRLDKENPELAKGVFHVADPALVEAKEYAVCGRYIQGERDWAALASSRATMKSMGLDDSLGPQHRKFANESFTHRTALLIALLVLDERTGEADLVAGKARLEWDDSAFQQAIEAALKGQVPPPFP